MPQPQVWPRKQEFQYWVPAESVLIEEVKRTNIVIVNLNFFFFLNQQFITWHMKANHGSYFCNYIHRTQTTLETNKEK